MGSLFTFFFIMSGRQLGTRPPMLFTHDARGQVLYTLVRRARGAPCVLKPRE